MLDIKRVIASAPRKTEQVELQALSTPWSEAVVRNYDSEDVSQSILEDCLGFSNHPHPQFAREQFEILDGWWDYRIVSIAESETAYAALRNASIPSEWDGQIRIPFSPEAPLSGVNRQLKPTELIWYRRCFYYPKDLVIDINSNESVLGSVPDELQTSTTRLQNESSSVSPHKNHPQKTRCIIHFEAVDYACVCYCNGVLVGTHEGGYLPFSFDISDTLIDGENEIALCAYDPSDEGIQLRGKQKLERGGIWYTAQSGIWQSVWLEVVPETRIESLAIDTQPDGGKLTLTMVVHDAQRDKGDSLPHGQLTSHLKTDDALSSEISHRYPLLTVKLFDNGVLMESLSSDRDSIGTMPPGGGLGTHIHTLTFSVDNPHLWSPDDPHLYHLELNYGSDKVTSYCAFRTIAMEEDEQGIYRLYLNHEPCFLAGVLDQGYWPDGLMTAPSDEALVHDIKTMKDLGFNMLRKHIKIESDRWYYHCDRLGMLVWQDMVCGGSPPKPWYSSYKPTFFRRSWGRYDDGPEHFHNLSSESSVFRAEWTETCAGTIAYLRNHPSIITWVLFNEAWGQFDARKATEMVRDLDPSRPIDAVSGWYDQSCGDFLSVHNYFRPLEVYKDSAPSSRAFVISEFGGLSYHLPEHSSLASSYGYESYSDIESFKQAVQKIITLACDLRKQGLAGFVYTQLSDVEEETNGLLTYDRRVNKFTEEDQPSFKLIDKVMS